MIRITSARQAQKLIENGDIKPGTWIYSANGMIEVQKVNIDSQIPIDGKEVEYIEDEEGNTSEDYKLTDDRYLTAVDLIGMEF